MTQVSLLGYGRFGRAMAGLLADAQIAWRALDPSADVPPENRATSIADLVASAEFVVVAVPVAHMKKAIADLAPHLHTGQVVLDVGSVKVGPAAAFAASLGDAIPWVPTHPLFGPLSLALAERPLRVVVCPNLRHPEGTRRVRDLYERLGCEIVEDTVEHHDQVMAHTHALTFFVAKGMLEAGAGMEVPFAPASFQALARAIEAVRSDAGHLFAAIQRENPYAADARGHLVEALTSIDRALRAPRDEGHAEEPERFAIPDLGAQSPEIREVRQRIDDVDHEIVRLIAQRTELAERAGKAKAELGRPILDPAREKALLESRRAWASQANLDAEGIAEIFQAIVRLSRRAQRG
jgi:prephenate dehydrogenase